MKKGHNDGIHCDEKWKRKLWISANRFGSESLCLLSLEMCHFVRFFVFCSIDVPLCHFVFLGEFFLFFLQVFFFDVPTWKQVSEEEQRDQQMHEQEIVKETVVEHQK